MNSYFKIFWVTKSNLKSIPLSLPSCFIRLNPAIGLIFLSVSRTFPGNWVCKIIRWMTTCKMTIAPISCLAIPPMNIWLTKIRRVPKIIPLVAVEDYLSMFLETSLFGIYLPIEYVMVSKSLSSIIPLSVPFKISLFKNLILNKSASSPLEILTAFVKLTWNSNLPFPSSWPIDVHSHKKSSSSLGT